MAAALVTRAISPTNDPTRQGLAAPTIGGNSSIHNNSQAHPQPPSSSTHSNHAGSPAAATEGLNPYAAYASGITPHSQEVHIVKVTGDTVHVAPGPPRETFLGKLGAAVLPGRHADPDALPLSPVPASPGAMSAPVGPPPPSPPASVDRLPLSESPQSASVALAPHPAGAKGARNEAASVTFEEPPADAHAHHLSHAYHHPSRFQSASAPGAPVLAASSSSSYSARAAVDSSRASSSSARPTRGRASTTMDDLALVENAPDERLSLSTTASTTTHPRSSGAHLSSSAAGDGYLHPPHAHRPTRRNTTGSAPFGSAGPSPLLPFSREGGGSLSEEPVADGELATDIQARAEQIRRERQSKRAKAQQEAEKALTRSGSKSTVLGVGDDNKPLVGNLIGEDHVNYVLMYNMLTGIRIAVSRCQAKIKRPLTEEDFTAKHKYSFDIIGNELTPSAKYDFKFKDYAPYVFRELREDHFHLDPADYLLSLTAKYILSELGSPGKSGSFFYFSRDYRFIIKTIHHSEHKFLRRIIRQYYDHVKENPHTLVSRFYGLHRVKLPRGRKIHFVIMNNLFPAHKDIHETYDLKGSTVGREYPEERAKENPRATLKDLNWINRGKWLEFGPEKRALLTEQLRRDAELLAKIGVMDYSLLVGIHNVRRGNRDNVRSNTLKVFSPGMHPPIRRKVTTKGGPSSPEAIAMRRAMRESDPKKLEESLDLPEEDTGDRAQFIFYQDDGGMRATGENNEPLDTIYYLGVIDILTPYNTLKKLEHIWKGFKDDSHKISPVPPEEYSDRFFRFMKAIMRNGGGGESFK